MQACNQGGHWSHVKVVTVRGNPKLKGTYQPQEVFLFVEKFSYHSPYKMVWLRAGLRSIIYSEM